MDFSAVPAALATDDGRSVAVNQAMASMIGYDIKSLLGIHRQEITAPDLIAQMIDITGYTEPG